MLWYLAMVLLEYNPWQYVPVPASCDGGTAPARGLLQWGFRRSCTPSLSGRHVGHGPVPCISHSPPPGPTILVTVENSVCSTRPVWLDACPWNVKASTRCGQWSCAGLGARPGECGGCPLVGQGHCPAVVIPAQPVAAVTDRRRWDCSGWKVLQRQR